MRRKEEQVDEPIRRADFEPGASGASGADDVVTSVRKLARSTANLGAASAEVLERELAMAIRISEQIRDRMISREALEEARKQEVLSSLRTDAHRAVDLVADVGAVGIVAFSDFLTRFIDQRSAPSKANESSEFQAANT
jgi:hypothetical protein